MKKIKFLLVKKYISVIIGAGVLSFGIYNVHSRSMISEGGALGLSLFLYHWFDISPGVSNLIMDILAMAAGAVVLQKWFLIDSIIASVAYSLWYFLFELFDPILPSLADFPLVAAVIGALFVGIGTSMIVNHGCAAGADDSLALIFQSKTKMNLSVFYVMSDSVVLLLSLTYIPVRQIAWSLLSIMLSSAIIAVLSRKKLSDN